MSIPAHEITQEELDTALEREIDTARRAATAAAALDPELAREYFAAMAMLIAQRSPGQVARMEAKIEGLQR